MRADASSQQRPGPTSKRTSPGASSFSDWRSPEADESLTTGFENVLPPRDTNALSWRAQQRASGRR
jgi:hypothetical protein